MDRMFIVQVHLFVYSPEYNSNTNDLKVFKLGIGNDMGYPTNDMVFGVEKS